MENLKGLYDENETITLPCGLSGESICCAENCPVGHKNNYKEIEQCYSAHKRKLSEM